MNERSDFITDDAQSFRGVLPPRGRLLGLDIGEKTVGLALSDSGRKIASPLKTLTRNRFTDVAGQIIELIQAEQVAGLVAGLPLNMDGSEGPKCQSVRQFARNFLELHEIPLLFQDERLSTVSAERSLLEADVSRKRRKEVIDKMAASVILQGALDRLASLSSS